MAVRHLVLPCGTDLSEEVGEFVEQLHHEADLPTGRSYWLRLAVDELTTNIAHHGYQDGSGVIDLESGIEAGQVWILIRDDSPPFDPRSHDVAARLRVTPAERQVGGYGLLLAMAKLDGFDYRREDGRNLAEIRMNRTDPGDDAGDEPGLDTVRGGR
jgi:serine/threonine-protein kinase RsbW